MISQIYQFALHIFIKYTSTYLIVGIKTKTWCSDCSHLHDTSYKIMYCAWENLEGENFGNEANNYSDESAGRPSDVPLYHEP